MVDFKGIPILVRAFRRVVVHDWDAVLPVAGDFGEMVATFTGGRRDRTDESYRGMTV